MKTFLFFSFAAAAVLAGCDATTNHLAELAIANEPTIVFSAGYQIQIAGRAVPIQGYDECPNASAMMTKFFGPDMQEGKATCVVLGKDRRTVPVLVGLPDGAVQENWEIIRETGKAASGRPYSRTSLRRPDGSLVVPQATE